ncbi:MAG: hypothetical protein LE178_05795 [Endomicrobium sp.]|nr:hypothetical protein [Endomicrobium sp.]
MKNVLTKMATQYLMRKLIFYIGRNMTGDKQNISDISYSEYEAIKKSLGLRDNLNGKYFDKDKNEISYAKFKRLILDEYNSRKANNNKPKYNFTQEESDDIDKTLGVTYDKEAERKEKE